MNTPDPNRVGPSDAGTGGATHGRRLAVRQDPRPRRGHPRSAGRVHGRADRPGRRGKVQPAGARRRRPPNSAGAGRGARRRHGRRGLSTGGLPAHRLHAAGAGQEPVPDAVGLREHRLLRPAVRPGPRRAQAPHRRAAGQYRAGALPRPAGRQAVRRHEAEALPVLRPDPRPGPVDPRRADHRRRSSVAPPVLGAGRPHPRQSAGHERPGGDRLHGGGRPLRLAGGDGRRPRARHRHAGGAAVAHRDPGPGRGLHRPLAGGEAPRPQGAGDPPAPAGRAGGGHRGARLDPAVRQFHGGRSRQLPDRARRDLRLPRRQWLRQVDDDEDAVRPAAAHRGAGLAVRRAGRCQRHRRPPQGRLHVAGLLAVLRADGTAELGPACPAL